MPLVCREILGDREGCLGLQPPKSRVCRRKPSPLLPLPPFCPVAAASTFSGVEFLAAKFLQKFLRVGRLLKTIDVKPLFVMIERVAARAESKASAEFMYLFVTAPFAETRRQHNLMRPALINAGRRQLAFSTHLRTAA